MAERSAVARDLQRIGADTRNPADLRRMTHAYVSSSPPTTQGRYCQSLVVAGRLALAWVGEPHGNANSRPHHDAKKGNHSPGTGRRVNGRPDECHIAGVPVWRSACASVAGSPPRDDFPARASGGRA